MLFVALQDNTCLPHEQKPQLLLPCPTCAAATMLWHSLRTMLASSIFMRSAYPMQCSNTASEASPRNIVMRASSKWVAVSGLDLYLRAAANFATSLSKVMQSCVHLGRGRSGRGVLRSEWNRGTQHLEDSNMPAPLKSLPQRPPQPPSTTTAIVVACATATCSTLAVAVIRGRLQRTALAERPLTQQRPQQSDQMCG